MTQPNELTAPAEPTLEDTCRELQEVIDRDYADYLTSRRVRESPEWQLVILTLAAQRLLFVGASPHFLIGAILRACGLASSQIVLTDGRGQVIQDDMKHDVAARAGMLPESRRKDH